MYTHYREGNLKFESTLKIDCKFHSKKKEDFSSIKMKVQIENANKRFDKKTKLKFF